MTEWFNLPWWEWIVFGVLLALLEIASPGGFYFIFFGVSAVVVGGMTWLNLIGEPWLQVTFFSIFSILASLFFRKPLMARFGTGKPDISVDSMIGEIGTAMDDIQASGFGKVELRGAAWTAKNSGNDVLVRGQRCKVERVDGLSLWVSRD